MNYKTTQADYFKRFNFFTKPVTLLLLKESGHRTALGVFFTLVVLSTVGLLFNSQIQSLIRRDNPTVLITQSLANPFPLNEKNFAVSIYSKLNLSYDYTLSLIEQREYHFILS